MDEPSKPSTNPFLLSQQNKKSKDNILQKLLIDEDKDQYKDKDNDDTNGEIDIGTDADADVVANNDEDEQEEEDEDEDELSLGSISESDILAEEVISEEIIEDVDELFGSDSDDDNESAVASYSTKSKPAHGRRLKKSRVLSPPPRINNKKLQPLQPSSFRSSSNAYPEDAIGYVPSVEQILEERRLRAADPSIKLPVVAKNIIMKHVVTSSKSRFLPLTRPNNVQSSSSSSSNNNKKGDNNNKKKKKKKKKKGNEKKNKGGNIHERTSDFYFAETDKCCYWCTEPINGVPYPLATLYSESKGHWWFQVAGQYCTPCCALADSLQRYHNKSHLTHFLFTKVYNFKTRCPATGKLQMITPAPRREVLQKFGGPMTIDQFRATGKLGIKSRFVQLPCLPLSMGIEEIERVSTTFREELDDNKLQHILAHGKHIKTQRPQTMVRDNPMPTSLFFSSRKPIKTKLGNTCTCGAVKKNTKRGLSREKTNGKTGKKLVATDSKNRIQQGQFATLPTIEEQLQYSSECLRLERKELSTVTKNRKRKSMNLLEFMKLESDTLPLQQQ
jgi:hypothetical protein